MKWLIMLFGAATLTACITPESAAAASEHFTTTVAPGVPSAMAGDPVSIVNTALGVLGTVAVLFGVKKGVDKVKASQPGDLLG